MTEKSIFSVDGILLNYSQMIAKFTKQTSLETCFLLIYVCIYIYNLFISLHLCKTAY